MRVFRLVGSVACLVLLALAFLPRSGAGPGHPGGRFATADGVSPAAPVADFLVPTGFGIDAGHTQLYTDNGYLGTGIAWADYNGDGWLDVYVTNNSGPNTLYRNDQGEFAPAPEASAVALPGAISGGASWADYDNDGDPDLLVLNFGRNVLFRNDGPAGFVDVTDSAGVGDTGKSETAAWGDFDNDGFLDLYVANWAMTCNNSHCGLGVDSLRDTDRLYRNLGDGTFLDSTALLSTPQRLGAGFVATWNDYDNDGDLDLYVVNDQWGQDTGNILWRNDGAGCGGWCFGDLSAASNTDLLIYGMGLAVGDYDNDGDLDYYMSNMGTSGDPMYLLQNQGDGTFVDVSAESNTGILGGVGWGTVFVDFDNDGWLDIYLSQALMMSPSMMPDALFVNQRDGTFTEYAAPGVHGDTMSVATADFDNDGRVDLMVGEWDGAYRLYRNAHPSGQNRNWVTVDLAGDGVAVNRDAVGARVTITRTDGAVQMQEVKLGSSMGVTNDARLHFGLGQSEIASATVRWPNGVVETFDQLPINTILSWTYGSADS